MGTELPTTVEGRADLARAFERDGFVLVPGLLAPDEVHALREAIEAAPERDDGPNPLTLGTMRFASNLFYGSEPLQRFLVDPRVIALVTALLGPDAWVRWDQAVWKRPGAPEFPLHQDNGYTGLDAAHLQLWVALTDMDQGNGGLVVAPGCHLVDHPHRWQGNHVVIDEPLPTRALDARAGDVVAFSSRLPHATTPNRSDRDRLAYVAELLPLDVADPSVPWPHLVAVRDGHPVGHLEGVPTPSPPAATAPAAPSPASADGARRGLRWWRRRPVGSGHG
ncbi:MAG: phytanoyl-CoA dioxygenase family protein [Acidimicrobiales bacterium]